jgi:hypothetical protein
MGKDSRGVAPYAFATLFATGFELYGSGWISGLFWWSLSIVVLSIAHSTAKEIKKGNDEA